MTYPGVQGLHSNISELRDSLSLPQISHEATEPVPFRGRCCQKIYDDSFDLLAKVIEALLDPTYQLLADARITLRSGLSNAPQFAALILPQFIDVKTLDLLCRDKRLIDVVYSEYTRRLSLSSSYPLFQNLWMDIDDRKETWRTIGRDITRDKRWRTAAIHRVWDDEDSSDALMGKQIVLNPENPAEYPEDQFHTMYSESSYVVGDIRPGDSVETSRPVEFHLFVDAKKCHHKSDKELLALLSRRNGEGFLGEEWFIGVHIVNLHRIVHIADFMKAGAEVLRKCPKELRRVDRSDKRENPDIRKQQGSQMYEIGGGARCDQVGALQAPHNFKRPETDELSKFQLIQEDDHLIDGVLAVNLCTIFVKLSLDYQCIHSLAHTFVERGNSQISRRYDWYVSIFNFRY
jgi:hypothetical protein